LYSQGVEPRGRLVFIIGDPKRREDRIVELAAGFVEGYNHYTQAAPRTRAATKSLS